MLRRPISLIHIYGIEAVAHYFITLGLLSCPTGSALVDLASLPHGPVSSHLLRFCCHAQLCKFTQKLAELWCGLFLFKSRNRQM